jgi:hypothetical protein
MLTVEGASLNGTLRRVVFEDCISPSTALTVFEYDPVQQQRGKPPLSAAPVTGGKIRLRLEALGDTFPPRRPSSRHYDSVCSLASIIEAKKKTQVDLQQLQVLDFRCAMDVRKGIK